MTFSAVKNITYAGIGGYTAGTIARFVLPLLMTAKVAGRAFTYYTTLGVAVGVVSATAKAVDQVFKLAGWTNNKTLRLVTAHVIVCVAIMPAMNMLVGHPDGLGRMMAAALTTSAFVVNLIVN